MPAVERARSRGKHLDLQRVTGGDVRGMLGPAITTRTGAERAQQINFREEFQIVAGAHGAGFHEILACIACEPGAHEDIQHVVNKGLNLGARHIEMICKRAGQIGVATVVILTAPR